MAMMRSGSNLLQQKMNAIDGVLCHGEIYNKHQSGLNKTFEKSEAFVTSLKTIDRAREPLRYLNQLIELSNADWVGFRLFENHSKSIIPPLIKDDRIGKIILFRNYLESYVSWRIAQQTKQWMMTQSGTRKEWQPICISSKEFKKFALEKSLYYKSIIHQCVNANQSYLLIKYSDLNETATDHALLEMLGSYRQLDHSQITIERQNPESLEQKIVNFAEFTKQLANDEIARSLAESDIP
jgi:hypothetical protein